MSLQRRHALFVLGSLLLIALKWHVIRELIRYAWDFENTNASQVFLIPFVSGALIYWNRDSIFRDVRFGPVAGVLTMMLGLVLPVAVRASGARLSMGDDLSLSVASILAVWVGGVLLFYGPSVFSAAMFPLLFLAFCIPIPSVVMDPLVALLQRGSAEISYLIIKLSGTPVYRQGFEFRLPHLAILVAPECSGIRSCISMLILSLLAGYLLLKTHWKRLALVLVAIPVMIFKNAIRIATLSLLANYVDTAIIESRLHREGGIPFFIVALVLIYPILTLLIKTERRKRPPEPALREVTP